MANAVVGRVLLIPKGNYSEAATYNMLDLVRYNNKSWVCKQNCTGQTPQEDSYWQLMASDGEDGGYCYIRYSANADGTGFDATPTPAKKYMGVYAGPSSTAPTNKTSYAWAKYIGEDGQGTGAWGGIAGKPFNSVGSDGLKVTSGVLDVDPTKVVLTTGNAATASRLKRITVTSSGSTNSGKWTKVGSWTASLIWSSYSAILSVRDAGNSQNEFIMFLCTRVTSTLNTPSPDAIHIVGEGVNSNGLISDFKLVYTAPLFELWFQPASSNSLPIITILNDGETNPGNPNAKLMTYYSNQPYQDTAPTGTVLECTPLPVTSDRLPTASSSVKGGIKIGANLTMDGDTLNAAVKGLITSENDFNAQTASTSKAVDSFILKEILDDINGIALTGTLTASATSITLTDAAIVTGNTVKYDYYTDVYGVSPTAVSVSTGSMTLTFDAQTVDVAVRVEIREV